MSERKLYILSDIGLVILLPIICNTGNYRTQAKRKKKQNQTAFWIVFIPVKVQFWKIAFMWGKSK